MKRQDYFAPYEKTNDNQVICKYPYDETECPDCGWIGHCGKAKHRFENRIMMKWNTPGGNAIPDKTINMQYAVCPDCDTFLDSTDDADVDDPD